MRCIALLFCLAAPLLAQQRPINLNFEETRFDGKPLSWVWITEPGYSFAASSDCRRPQSRCVTVRYQGESEPRDFGYVMQTFDGTHFRGKQIRLRAWLRVNDPELSRAQLFVRVDSPTGVGFHDYSHAQPIRSRDWTMREIAGKVDSDAVRIAIGMMLGGRGSAYLADLEFETVEDQH
jgi:hypothetical protein